MTNGFRDLLVGGGEPIYVKLKEVGKLVGRGYVRWVWYRMVVVL